MKESFYRMKNVRSYLKINMTHYNEIDNELLSELLLRDPAINPLFIDFATKDHLCRVQSVLYIAQWGCLQITAEGVHPAASRYSVDEFELSSDRTTLRVKSRLLRSILNGHDT